MLISDVFQFSREGRAWNGAFPLSSFKRLADMLADRAGEVQVALAGHVDGSGQARIMLEISGELNLQCQRCLQPMPWPMVMRTVLQPVPVGHPVEQEELQDDDCDVLETAGVLNVQVLAEDEILLALPLVARHKHCSPPEMERDDHEASPFAVLAGLRAKS